MAELYTCCVKSCKVYNKLPYQKRHFIKFPFENKPLLKNWIKALTNHCRYILPDVHTVICNNHFKRRDYAIDDGYMKVYVRAIPSVYGYKGNTKQELVVENNSLLNNVISNIIIYNVRGNFQCESQLQPQKDMGSIVDDSTDSIDVDLDNTAIENQSNICTKNTMMKLMKTNTPKPNAIIDVDLDQTMNENQSNIGSNDTKILMKTNTPKPNASLTTNSPTVWISKHNKTNYKYNIPYKFLQKLKILTRKNERLISKNRCLMTRIQSMKDIQIKYLELKTKVLETEEKLLMNGIDTSEYSAFQISYDEPEPQQNDNQMDDDILFECSLERLKSIPINNSNPHVSSEFSPNIEIIISSDEDTEIID